MAKIVALGAYLYQALMAFGLLIVVSHLLPASDYAAYSLFIAIVQFADIVCFQWIRAAASRFYPGPDEASEKAERGVIFAELAASAGFCLVAACLAPVFGVPVWLGLVAAVGAILQGTGELYLTMLRFRLEFRLFSWLQGARATIMAAATIICAALGADLAHVLAGFLIGNLIYGVIAWARTRHLFPLYAHWRSEIIRRDLAYGGISAGAGAATLLVPLGLKTIFLGTLGAAAAGPMLALDLLQRPFIMITSSLQAIRFPELLVLFDRKGDSEAFRAELGRYYAAMLGLSLVGAAGVVALLGFAARIIVPEELEAGFLRTAPFILVLALLRSLVQHMLPALAHLHRRLPLILGLACLDSALTCAGALAAALLFSGSDRAIAAGTAAGAVAAMALGLILLGLRNFAMPARPVLLSGMALALSSLSVQWFSADLPIATDVALAVTAALGIPPVLTFVRWIAR